MCQKISFNVFVNFGLCGQQCFKSNKKGLRLRHMSCCTMWNVILIHQYDHTVDAEDLQRTQDRHAVKSIHRMLKVLLLLHQVFTSSQSQWLVQTPNTSLSHSPRHLGHMPPSICHLLTNTCQLPLANRRLPTTTCQLSTATCQLSTANCQK